MEKYDVVIVGGGIGGSIAARLSAINGFKTLLIEKYKTPRNKSCSGIQFGYFKKMIGVKIPPQKLCRNEINKVEIVSPGGRTVGGRIHMLNFWRSTFDRWLNDVAVCAGSEFSDNTSLVEFTEGENGLKLQAQSDDQTRNITTRYLIAADGLHSPIRKRIRPDDFQMKGTGGSVNYYCKGETSMDPNTLYMVHNRDFAPLMFAWAYMKDDQWVIGTGADVPPKKYADRFFNYIKNRYGFKGEIIRREGFASPLKGGVFLGRGHLLFCGDAAGLIDMYRGVGMDNAVLSAMSAVKAIVKAEKGRVPVIACYQSSMTRMIQQLRANEKKQKDRYMSNEELEISLSPINQLKEAMLMMSATIANTILPVERLIVFPL